MYLLKYYLKDNLLREHYIDENELNNTLSHFKYYDANIIETDNLIVIEEDDWNRIEIYK